MAAISSPRPNTCGTGSRRLRPQYDAMLQELSSASKEELEKCYVEREREPDLSSLGTWRPKETQYL
jgi:hypothetical protein